MKKQILNGGTVEGIFEDTVIGLKIEKGTFV